MKFTCWKKQVKLVLAADDFSEPDGFLFQASVGVACLDALKYILAQKRQNSTHAFVLHGVHKFMNKQTSVVLLR